jgi:hypothetical protein
MAKPPFNYKPTAKIPPGTVASEEQVELVGSQDVLAAYADVFVVGNEEGTGMASLYFYQRVLPDRKVALERTETGFRATKARCVSRIVMAPQAVDRFLVALAGNRGFVLSPRAPGVPKGGEEKK